MDMDDEVKNYLKPEPSEVPSFEFMAAHYLVGCGLGPLTGDHVRGLAHEFKHHYGIGFGQGRGHTGFVTKVMP